MTAISPHDGPVAVTGVSGFTGGHMVRELVLHGYEVRACLRNADSWRGKDCVQYLNRLPNVEIVDGCDLFVPGSYDEAFAGCSGVFHVAAVLGNSADGKSQPLGSGNVSTDVYEGGMAGTRNVIDAVNRSGSVKRVVYTSSLAAVSGLGPPPQAPGFAWSETVWACDHFPEEAWQHPRQAYARSKVDTERLLNRASDDSGGRWDVVTLNPAMICGPVLFKAQVGQWIEQIGRLAAGLATSWPTPYDMHYNIIDVRDLVKAERLAAESDVDHRATNGGARYLLHGSGGRSALRLGTEVTGIVQELFPSFVVGDVPEPEGGTPRPAAFNHSGKATTVLGATLRPVEDTIRAVVETSIELGVIEPRLKSG